jgi:CcmD family protein
MGYLVAAYLILWLGMFGYLFWMSGALRGLRAELSELRAAQQERTVEVHEEPVVPPVESRGR